MKYTLIINQLAMQEIAPELDAIDGIILDYLIHFCRADDAKIARLTIESDGKSERFTWINFTQLIRELPILKIKTKGAISRRIDKIEKSGFIKIAREPGKPRAGKLFIRLTAKIHDLFFQPRVVLKQPQGLPQNNPRVATKQPITVTDNNKHNKSKRSAKADSSPDVLETPEAIENQKVKKVIEFFSDACLTIRSFRPRITPQIEVKMIKNYLKDFTVDQLTDEMDWFLKSEECEKLGCTIKIALCAYVFNKWQDENEN